MAQNITGDAVSVGPAYRNLEHMGQADPRVRVNDTGRTATDGTALWQQAKYGSLGDPIPIATGDEAQLIVAEAAVVAGELQDAIDIINTFHGRAGLSDFSSTDPAEILDHIIMERHIELFLEGHHLGDIIRYDLPLEPKPGTAFPKGGSYGPDGSELRLPLPNIETVNNPNIG